MATTQRTEQERHQYLNMLGIDSWLSRTALPGAASSEDWVKKFIYDDVLLDTNTVLESSKIKAHPKSSNVDESLQKNVKNTNEELNAQSNNAAQARALAATFEIAKPNTPASIKPTSKINTQEIELDQGHPLDLVTQQEVINQSTSSIVPIYTPSSTKTSKAAPVMRLMFWLYEDILVVDSLPTHSRGTLSSVKYEQLLTNLIKAMGSNAQRIMVNQQGERTLAQGSQPYTLNWPTLAGLSIDQGWEQAVSAVQHKLSKTLQFYSPRTVLMLGESAGQMLMNLEDDFDGLRGVTFAIRKDITAITTFSLTQMLNVPGCKRDVWMDLQKVLNT